MKRHLIWIITGCATLTLAVPAIAASRDAGTPDDNGVPGEVRGNCDEAEHAGQQRPGRQRPDRQRPDRQRPGRQRPVGEYAVDEHARRHQRPV